MAADHLAVGFGNIEDYVAAGVVEVAAFRLGVNELLMCVSESGLGPKNSDFVKVKLNGRASACLHVVCWGKLAKVMSVVELSHVGYILLLRPWNICYCPKVCFTGSFGA